MMFQFAKSLKSEAEPQHTACPASLDTVSRLETHGSQTVSPHGLSPLEASFLLNAQASIQCILFDAVGIEPTERLPSTIFDHAIYDCVFSSHFRQPSAAPFGLFLLFFVCVPMKTFMAVSSAWALFSGLPMTDRMIGHRLEEAYPEFPRACQPGVIHYESFRAGEKACG